MQSLEDPALLRALARGYQWFGELASGRVSSTKQIAAREGVSDSYVRHVVPLGLLAPEIVEAICVGQQSVEPLGGAPEGSRSSPDRMGCAAAASFGLEIMGSDLARKCVQPRAVQQLVQPRALGGSL